MESRLSVASDSGELSAVLREAAPHEARPESPSGGKIRGGALDPALGVLILVHAPPVGHKDSKPLPQLAELIKCATLRFDLTGCGDNGGKPCIGSHERDAVDIRAAVLHVRERLRRNVLGLFGVGEGGTAVLSYAARFGDVTNIVTLSARAEQSNWLERSLTWTQLDTLQKNGEIEWSYPNLLGGSMRSLVATRADMNAKLDLTGLARCKQCHLLTLHGSQDEEVPVSNAHTLQQLAKGCASHELRIIPGVGHHWDGKEDKLAYAISEWLWRKTRAESGDGGECAGSLERSDSKPSGFNIFVDDLSAQVKEIHAAARMNLPSMPDDDDDDDDE